MRLHRNPILAQKIKMNRPVPPLSFATLCLIILLILAGNGAHAQMTTQPLSARLPVDINSPFCQGRQTWDEFSEYHVALLRLALKYNQTGIVLKPVCMDYPTEKRRIAMLETGDETNIVFFGTSPEREKKLLAVHFPIFLGTTGLRLFLTRPEISPKLDAVKTLDDLRQFTFGQGLGWPDSTILQQNDLAVIEGRYITLHSMLARQRFDLYPRAYWQIQGEYNWMHQSEPQLVINKNVALYYPQPIYFFVSPSTPHLHDAILTGLERAWQAGAVQELLRSNPQSGPSFQQINPAKLHLIYLPKISQTAATDQAMQKYGLISQEHFITGVNRPQQAFPPPSAN